MRVVISMLIDPFHCICGPKYLALDFMLMASWFCSSLVLALAPDPNIHVIVLALALFWIIWLSIKMATGFQDHVTQLRALVCSDELRYIINKRCCAYVHNLLRDWTLDSE